MALRAGAAPHVIGWVQPSRLTGLGFCDFPGATLQRITLPRESGTEAVPTDHRSLSLVNTQVRLAGLALGGPAELCEVAKVAPCLPLAALRAWERLQEVGVRASPERA